MSSGAYILGSRLKVICAYLRDPSKAFSIAGERPIPAQWVLQVFYHWPNE